MSRLLPLAMPIALAGSLLAVAVPADAAMTVGTFVTRANVLRDQGFAAMLSPDFQVLKEEARMAKTQLRADDAARVAAHKPRIACVPEGQSVGIEEMLDGLAALPAADRRRPLKDGYAKVLAARFPCR